MSNGRHRARIKRHPLRVSLLAPAVAGAATFGFLLVPSGTHTTTSPVAVSLAPTAARTAAVSRSGSRAAMTAKATPKAAAKVVPAGLDFSPCANDSVEAGLQPGTILVHRAVCHAFPQVLRYGGLGAGEHANGKAIDVMLPIGDTATGYAIADFLKAHAAEFNLFDVIYRQHIWTPIRAGEGWRQMPDRGSLTANHYDHVHVSIN